MNVITENIRIVRGFRLTEYKVYNGDDLVDTYFNIRNDKGTVLGCDYDDVETPLDIIMSMWADEGTSLTPA